MMTRIALAGVMMSIGMTAAYAQNVALPPVINPLPAKATLPDGLFELSGVTLGSSREEAAAALTALGKGTASWEKPNIPDPRYMGSGGINFRFKQPPLLQQVIKGSDRSTDTYSVSMTSNVNETRAYRIDRRLNHATAAQQISVPDLVGALTAKYGNPSWHDEAGRKLYWIWFEGKRVAAGAFDPSDKAFGKPGGCLYAGVYVPEIFYFDQPGSFRNLVGCQTVIEVGYAAGQRPDLSARVNFLLLDVERFRRNVMETDAWARAELQKIVDGKGGTAPKL